jgi:hypothetical protein
MDRLLCEGSLPVTVFGDILGGIGRANQAGVSHRILCILVSLLGLANANRTLRPAETIDCVGDEAAQVTRYL